MPETNCNLVDAIQGLGRKRDANSVFNNILKFAQNSKENFDQKGRTIIFLDEFARDVQTFIK